MNLRTGGAMVIALVVVALLALGGTPSAAQGTWPTIALQTVVSGLSAPTHVTSARDGTNRLFVTQQDGQIRIVQNGTILSPHFLDISGRVKCCGEEGLLSVAFPPNYATKRYFYVYYTDNNGNQQISRFHVPAGTPNVADPNSEQMIINIPHPTNNNHNGGQLAFGADGYLYLFTGDGGGGGDTPNNAQNIEVLLGKVLRLDVETNPTAGYLIPPGNPFVGVAGRDEIWAYGLRNPWRSSFDRATGDLYIADVGQNQWEEVNMQPGTAAGVNYGWRCYEGNHPYNMAGCSTNPASYVFPVTEYDHNLGYAVAGGHVYRGVAYPTLTGIYFYADTYSNRLWGLRRNGTAWETQQLLTATGSNIVSFGEDEAGEIYVVGQGDGKLQRLVATGPTPTPTMTRTPTRTVTPDPTLLKLYLPMIFK